MDAGAAIFNVHKTAMFSSFGRYTENYIVF
jgi:hypothetical protein